MSKLPAVGAVEVDRLVLGVNRARDQERLARIADEAGLAEWHLLGHWWDFLLAGNLTRDLARLRTRYWPTSDVDAFVDLLLGGRLVHEHDGRLLDRSLRKALNQAGPSPR